MSPHTHTTTWSRTHTCAPPHTPQVGLNRDKWVITPSCTTADHLAAYEMMGKVYGIAMRTKMTLDMDLAPIIWKALVGESVNVDDLQVRGWIDGW